MKILSLVIPSYNCEQYLDKCLLSFVDGSVLDKLDIVIVNDGSSDGTEDLAGKYCRQYPESVRLISQENRGHGGALNTGCSAARGKYLKVIDADDWVETEKLAAFVEQLEHCDSDVVLTHYYTTDISSGEVKAWTSRPEQFGQAYSFKEIMDDFGRFERCLTFHGLTYNTAFYQANGYRLSEKIFYEDHEFATYPCCRAQTITPLDLFIYNYRIGDVQQSVSDANKLKRVTHSEAVLRRMAQEYLRLPEGMGKAARRYVCHKIKVVLISYLTTVLLVEKDKKLGRVQAAQIMKYIKSELPAVYALAGKKYQLLRLLNCLHVSKAALDSVLQSGLYKRIMKK